MNRLIRRSLLLVILALLLTGQAADRAPQGDAASDASAESDAAPVAAPPSAIPAGSKVAVIRLEGLIYDFKLQSLKRRVQIALDRGASVVVIEIETQGGLVTTALDICRYIKGDVRATTIAWIHDEAYSAGAIIAAACKQIVMSPASATGAAAPVSLTGELDATMRDKVLSGIKGDLKDSALSNGHSLALLRAMVVDGAYVYLIEHPPTGRVRAVNEADFAFMVEGDEGGGFLQTAREKASQLLGNADAHGGPWGTIAETEDRGQWKPVERVGQLRFPGGLVHDGDGLLTLNQREAVAATLADTDTIANDNDLKQYLNAAEVFRVNQHWSEVIAYWLTHPFVRAILILVMMLAAFIELSAPGVGWAGGIALVCLVCLIGAPFLVGLAQVWHLILVVVGVGLVLAEIFVTPGFGVLGASGIGCILVGIVLAVVPGAGGGPISLPAPEALGELQLSLAGTFIAILFGAVGMYFLFKFYGQVPILNRMVLHDPPPAPGTPGGPPRQHVAGEEEVGGEINVGDEGTATIACHPSGRAQFGDHVIDVVSTGSWIDAGQKVRVVEAGFRVLVEEVTE